MSQLLRTLVGALAGALAAVLALAAPAAAQDATYGARLASGVVRVGEETSIVVVIENANGSIVSLPEVDGLEIGPAGEVRRASSTVLSVGRRETTTTLTWRVPVLPLRDGDFEIPGVELSVAGQRVTTKPFTLAVVEDLRGAELGFLDLTMSPPTPVERQPFVIELTFGWDSALGSVNYANLIVPWMDKLTELLELEAPPSMAQEVTINLNTNSSITVEEVAPVRRDGRDFRTFRLRKVYLPTRATELDLAAGYLEFGEQRRGGFLSRGKKDTYFAPGEPLRIRVGSLPTEGQPLDYTGAIGTLEATAEPDTRDVDVGESIKLRVTYTGEGNLMFFDPPDLSRDEAFEGFRFFGSTNVAKTLRQRTFELDIAPLDDSLTEIPPVRLPVYDPEQGAYVEVATPPIPIRVRALEGEVALEGGERGEGFDDDIRDIRTDPILAASGDGEGGGPGPVGVGIAAFGAVALWVVVRTAVRRRLGDPHAPLERRRRSARKALTRELSSADDPSDVLRALLRFLSARTREPEWAWIGRDPMEHFEDLDDPELEEGCEMLALTIRNLERAAYAADASGESEDTPGEREVLAVADQLLRGGL